MAAFPTWLFQRVSVLLVRFEEEGRYRATFYPLCLHKGKVCLSGGVHPWSPEAEKPEGIEKHPLLVLCYGQGVVCKPTDGSSGVMERVEADPERFLWSRCRSGEEEAEYFCFVQRIQVAPLLERLEGLPLADVRYIPAPEEKRSEETTAARAREYFQKDLSWGRLLLPSVQGALLGSMLARRLRLPVLIGVLLLLMGNYLLGERITQQRRELQQELSALEKGRGEQDRSSQQRRRLLTEFERNIPLCYSLLCDRIGSIVPAAVTLFSLEVQPLQKELVLLTPLTLAENSVQITGVCLEAALATELTTRLGQEPFARELTLARLERDSQDGLLHFTITLQL